LSGSKHAYGDQHWIDQARSRLALRRREKPVTKAGQIRALWPDIETALAVGQSMKTICAWLAEDAGITLGVTSLTSYVSRIRRRQRRNRLSEVPMRSLIRPEVESVLVLREEPLTFLPKTVGTQPQDDPLAQAMRVLSRSKMDIRKMHNDGDPEGGNLI
jgi:hypothetical protein